MGKGTCAWTCRWLLVALACVGCNKHVEPVEPVTAEPVEPAGPVEPVEPGARTTTAATAPRSLPPRQPFASHRFEYTKGAVLPNHRDAAALDQATAESYDVWQARYLRPGCGTGEYHVKPEGPHDLSSSRFIGHGMLITSLVAGHDPQAKQYFDGLFRYFLAHQSALTPGLMAWYQDERCQDMFDSQSDSEGDLDIAYALMLADKQWGSCGEVDYAARARWVIDAITRGDMHREGRYMLLGDSVAPTDARYDTTRPSAFMPGHLRGFEQFMQQAWWVQVVDNGYWLLDYVQTTHSQVTGLLPNVIVAADSDEPRPQAPQTSRAAKDDRFGMRTSLVPLRIGTDYVAYGDARAKRVLERMNTFVKGDAVGEPSRIAPGYALSGEPSLGPGSMLFTAPLGVAAMTDAKHQDWLNRLWDRIEAAASEGYAPDSVRLLSMLVMSGNWWVPDRLPDPCASR